MLTIQSLPKRFKINGFPIILKIAIYAMKTFERKTDEHIHICKSK